MSFSGGLCSWFAAKRMIKWHGRKNVTLLFADVKMEHHDLYRFMNDASEDLGVPITRISKDMTPWDVFFKHRMMGNTLVDMCSRELKRELLDAWRRDNCDPRTTTVCCGLSFDEKKRYVGRWEKDKKTGRPKFLPGWRPWMRAKGWVNVCAPAMAAPFTDKSGMLAELRASGLEPSDSYEDGFAHDNCGGFCIKQGQKGFINLLTKRPEVYAFHEGKEQEFRAYVGKDVSILRDRRGGTTRPLTLKVLRERIEAKQFELVNFADEGKGCGCAIDR
jgi:hypothetical protein